jgi:glutathione S-transferase
VLEDGDFRLTESSAILKYLADRLGSPAYPAELQARARVNQWMDWFNTAFYRELGYGVVYPQIVPDYRHADPAIQREHLARGHAALDRRLQILNARLAASGGPFTCGTEVSLADYLGSIFLSIGELVKLDLAPYPAVACWMAAMKARPAWDEVNAAFYGWCSAVHAQAA